MAEQESRGGADGQAATPDRRAILKSAVAGGALIAGGAGIVPAASAAAAGDLTWLPAWRIRDMIGRKEVSPVEVTDHFLARIETFNPTLKAFRHLDAKGAREQAKRAEETVMRGEPLGPLHGIPISVKEHIGVAGMPVLALAGGPPVAVRDEVGVARLRAGGAVIVGTNTMMGTSAPARGGFNIEAEARNPWDPSRATGWSSSGGAASVAAGLLPMTIGSDGGGSTRLPGSICGVIGLHPSVGRIPTVNYDRPGLNLTGTIGPLARDARDAALAMKVLAGPDGRDPGCLPYDPPDYLANLDKGVAGMRFAWTDDYGYGSMYELPQAKTVVATVRKAALGFTRLGASVEPTKEAWEDFWPGYLVTQQIFGRPAPGAPAPTPEQIQNALDVRGRNLARFRSLFASNDLLLSATAQFTAYRMEEWLQAWTTDGPKYPHGTFAPTYTIYTHMFNWLGLPAVSVPCGFVDGLPVGLQIVGTPGREAQVLQAAAAFLKAYPRPERPRIS